MKKTRTLIVALVLILAVAFTVPSVFATATQVDTAADLQSAIAADADLVLGDNITLDSTLVLDGVDVILDLGGKTLTTTASTGIKLTNGATLTVKNGTVDATEDAFRVEAGTTLTIEDSATVDSQNANCVYIIGEGATLNTAGTLNTTSTGYAAIQGSGNAGRGGITVNVTGGSITATNVAIYFPNTSNLNISDGVIIGKAAVYIKSGALTITGGSLTGTGTKADYVFNGNGGNITGDAVIIDACNYPGGNPTVSISGGDFYSDNNKAVGSYNANEAEALEGFITGGHFTGAESMDESLLADGIEFESDGKSGFVAVDPSVSEEPSDVPSEEPSDVPSEEPSDVPTEEPSDVPTEEPSDVPSEEPSDVPSEEPSDVPSEEPSDVPSEEPSNGNNDDSTETGDSSVIIFVVIVSVAVIALAVILTAKKRYNKL